MANTYCPNGNYECTNPQEYCGGCQAILGSWDVYGGPASEVIARPERVAPKYVPGPYAVDDSMMSTSELEDLINAAATHSF